MTDDLEMETHIYFLSALIILSEEQKSFVQVLLEEQQQGHENYYSECLYWI